MKQMILIGITLFCCTTHGTEEITEEAPEAEQSEIQQQPDPNALDVTAATSPSPTDPYHQNNEPSIPEDGIKQPIDESYYHGGIDHPSYGSH